MARSLVRRSQTISLSISFSMAAAAIACGTAETETGTATSALVVSPDLVISQVFGGGGNTNAPYRNDFVELFNRGSQPVSLNGKALQYAGQNSPFVSAQAVALPNVTLQPGQYFLVQLASGGNAGAALPTADHTDATMLSNTSGKVALVESTALLSNCGSSATPCAAGAWIDFVGYGGAAQFEGTPAGALNNQLASMRKSSCVDTGDNGADFQAIAPAPRNTASTITVCATDAGAEAGADGGTVDASLDVTTPEAGPDAEADATADASPGDAAADGAVPVDAGADASPDAAADASTDSGPIEAGPPASLVLLNEIRSNPPGNVDSPWEFVEILCTPGASLAGHYFVAFEGDGDSAGPPGTADFVVDLGAVNCGSNGIVYIKAAQGGQAAQSAQSTVVTAAFLDNGPSPIENATTTFAIVKSPNAAIVQGADYDDDDDGTLELPGGASVIDVVATFDESQNVTDHTYAPRLAQPGGTADGATRFPSDTTPLSAAAWYSGDLLGTSAGSVDYDATNVSASYPIDGKLTPGAPNVGTAGTSGVIDAGTDAGGGADGGTLVDSGPKPTDASTPKDSGTTEEDATVPTPADAGRPRDAAQDAPADASSNDFPPSASGCACDLAAASAPSTGARWMPALGFALVAWLRRRRRA